MTIFSIKKGDLLPELELQLKFSNGQAANLTGYTEVRFLMRPVGSATNKINDTSHVTVTDTTNGKIKYSWTGTDTDTVGEYDAEVRGIDANNKPVTFPGSGYLLVNIHERLMP